MRVLGVSAFYHDSVAALIVDGRIVAAVQEERFSRKKHDARFPKHTVAYCLREAGLHLEDLDCIAFYDKPLLKFERLLETYLSFAPRGWRSFVAAMPVWLKEKLFLEKFLRTEFAQVAAELGGRSGRNRFCFPNIAFLTRHLRFSLLCLRMRRC